MKRVIGKIRKRGVRAGFTLIEQLIAASVMAVVLGSLFLTLGFMSNMTQLTQQNERATQILEDKMELIRLYTWQQITNGTSIS